MSAAWCRARSATPIIPAHSLHTEPEHARERLIAAQSIAINIDFHFISGAADPLWKEAQYEPPYQCLFHQAWDENTKKGKLEPFYEVNSVMR